jgi:hypothetical protein
MRDSAHVIALKACGKRGDRSVVAAWKVVSAMALTSSGRPLGSGCRGRCASANVFVYGAGIHRSVPGIEEKNILRRK